MKIRAVLGLVVAAMLLSGCISKARHPGVRTRAFLYDAWYAWESGRNEEALQAIRQALVFAAKEKVAPEVLVEVYDDAGLYFHVNGRAESAVLHQAVAVLLARKFGLPEAQQQMYEGRLRTALGTLEPAPGPASLATERLLALPRVKADPQIRKFYGQ